MFKKKNQIQTIEPYLSRYLDGELSLGEIRVVDAHLQSNPDLQKEIESLRRTDQEIQNAVSETEPMNTVILRLQQFVSTLPQTEPAPSIGWLGTIKPIFTHPAKLKYAGLAMSFLILTLLIVPTLIQPQMEALHAIQEKYPDQSSYGLFFQIDNDGDVNGDGIQDPFSLGKTTSKGAQKINSQRGDDVRRGVAAGRYAAGYEIERFGEKNKEGVSTYEYGKGISLGKKLGREVAKDTPIMAGVPILGDLFAQTDLPIQPAAGDDKSTTEPSNPALTAQSRKVIRNANMLVEVETLSEAQSTVERLVSEANGLSAQFTLREKEKPPWAQYTLWIPAERLDSVIEEFKKLGEVQHLEVAVQDISEQYFDQETRIKNMQRQEERLLKLYEHDTVKMEELLKVEQEIARIRTEIEQMQGRQRLWDRQIQYSTLSLNLRQKPEEEPIVKSEANDVFTPVRRAGKDALAVVLYSCSLVTTLIAWIFSFALFVVPWLAMAGLAWWGGKRLLKR